MKVKHIITTSGIILGGLAAVQGASAVVKYTGSSEVQFTFAPTLSLALTGDDFQIDELFPGNSDISNEVTATVSTNSVAGYELSATVGNDTTYNSTALMTVGGDTIAMVSGNALTSGTWGYTLDNGTTYGALSRSTDTILNKTTDVSGTAATGYTGTSSTSMKIGAYAASDQVPGVYNNIVNFKAVANQLITCDTTITGNMQDFDPCPDIAIGTTGTLTDARDSKSYTVAKLDDGNWWMTTNLDLAGGTEIESTKSDVPANYTLDTSAGFQSGNRLPASSTTFSDDTQAYVNNSNSTTCGDNSPCYSYYSWIAATAGSGSSASPDDGGRAAYSICPKGWKLPSATTEGVGRDTNNGYTGGDFYKLAIQYGMATGNYYESPDNAPTFYSQAGPGTTPNFLLAGDYYSGSFGNGDFLGSYWSSSSRSSTNAYYLFFDSSFVYSPDSTVRNSGFPVRCLFAGS